MSEQVKEMQKFAYENGYTNFNADTNPYEDIPELGFLIDYYEAGKRMGIILNKQKQTDIEQLINKEGDDYATGNS